MTAYLKEMLPITDDFSNLPPNRLALEYVKILEQVEVYHPRLIEFVPSQLRSYVFEKVQSPMHRHLDGDPQVPEDLEASAHVNMAGQCVNCATCKLHFVELTLR